MAGRALFAGAKSLVLFLIKAILFPLTWMWAMGVAKAHSGSDAKASQKVVVAIIVGLIAAPAIGYMIYDFQEDARTNMYGNLEGRLNQILGNASHADQVTTIGAKQTQVDVLGPNLAAATAEREAALAAGDLEAYEAAVGKEVVLFANLAIAQRELGNAETYAERLEEEAGFFGSVRDHIAAQDDAAIRAAVAARVAAFTVDSDITDAFLAAEKDADSAQKAFDQAEADVLALELIAEGRPLTAEEQMALDDARAAEDAAAAKLVDARAAASQARATFPGELPVPKDVHNWGGLIMRTDRALEIKDKAEADMMDIMVFLIYPGLIGVFYAPLFVALGSIMANAWEPSETIGYKKYPGLSLALFLFFGAFGWPALLFSAWGFWDIDVRAKEGQIAL